MIESILLINVLFVSLNFIFGNVAEAIFVDYIFCELQDFFY